MYVPPHFAETRASEIRRIIEAHPLGSLITYSARGLDADQIPFELTSFDGAAGILRAHIARANPLWREIRDGSDALVIFRAADAYISPNWYPSKKKTHRVVPTWNYQVVNVYGQIHFFEDRKSLLALIGKLTRSHETHNEGAQAWRMADAPKDFIDAMMEDIIGLEIRFSHVTAKSKLGQNKEDPDRKGAARTLLARGHSELGDAMGDV
jgi:transcriptional regulator